MLMPKQRARARHVEILDSVDCRRRSQRVKAPHIAVKGQRDASRQRLAFGDARMLSKPVAVFRVA